MQSNAYDCGKKNSQFTLLNVVFLVASQVHFTCDQVEDDDDTFLNSFMSCGGGGHKKTGKW